jgi:hypothetical protein
MAFNYSPKVITEGLVLYLDAANVKSYVSGSTVWNDLSRNRNTGTLTNGPTFSSANGGTIIFDGLDDRYTSLMTSEINTIYTNNSLTLSVFFKSNFTGEYRDVVGLNKISGNNPFVIRQNISNELFYDTEVGGIRHTPRISFSSPNDTWIYACATFGNNQIKTYYNGVLISTTNTVGNIRSFDTNAFGILPLGYGYFKGTASSTNLYNRALSAAEVLQNFNSTKTRFGL